MNERQRRENLYSLTVKSRQLIRVERTETVVDPKNSDNDVDVIRKSEYLFFFFSKERVN